MIQGVIERYEDDQLVVGGIDWHARHFQQREAAVEARNVGDALAGMLRL